MQPLTEVRMSREEREEMYKLARERIFGSSENSVQGKGMAASASMHPGLTICRERWRERHVPHELRVRQQQGQRCKAWQGWQAASR